MLDIKKTDVLIDEDEVMTVEELERVLKISRTKSYELANAGEFPVKRIGRALRIPRKSFYEWFYKN